MPEPRPIDAAGHLDFLRKSCGLMLHFAWRWAEAHPREPFGEILLERTDLFRRTDFSPFPIDSDVKPQRETPAWMEMVGRLAELREVCRREGRAAAFEPEGLALLEGHLAARVARDLADFAAGRSAYTYTCGSLRHDPDDSAEHPGIVQLHIGNVLAPDSPFRDPAYLPQCLLQACARIRRLTGHGRVGCKTWLNSHPRWLALFPPAWHEHLDAPDRDIQGNLGFWGQFVRADRRFNERAGTTYRDSDDPAVLPFENRHAWCAVDDLETFLRERFEV